MGGDVRRSPELRDAAEAVVEAAAPAQNIAGEMAVEDPRRSIVETALLDRLGKILAATEGEAAVREFVGSLPVDVALGMLASYVALHRWIEDEISNGWDGPRSVDALVLRLSTLSTMYFPTEEERRKEEISTGVRAVLDALEEGDRAKIYASASVAGAFAEVAERLLRGGHSVGSAAGLLALVFASPERTLEAGRGTIYYDLAVALDSKKGG